MKGLLGKRQTIKALAALSDLSEDDIEKAIDALGKLAWQTLEYRVSFVVAGLGTFSRRSRKARTLRNPMTKELMRVDETHSIGFRPSNQLRRAARR